MIEALFMMAGHCGETFTFQTIRDWVKKIMCHGIELVRNKVSEEYWYL